MKHERGQGRAFLNALRERAQAAGAPLVDARLRHGDLEVTLSDQQEGVRLFVPGRRGASAVSPQRDLGRSVEWVFASCSVPP